MRVRSTPDGSDPLHATKASRVFCTSLQSTYHSIIYFWPTLVFLWRAQVVEFAKVREDSELGGVCIMSRTVPSVGWYSLHLHWVCVQAMQKSVAKVLMPGTNFPLRIRIGINSG
jgi:hypothetical protein